MNKSVEHIELFSAYLAGKITFDELNEYIQAYQYAPLDFEQEFFLNSIEDDKDAKEKANKLLLLLNIDFDLWWSNHTRKMCLFAFLKELIKEHEHSIQLNQLLFLLIKQYFAEFLSNLKYATIVVGIFAPVVLISIYYQFQGLFHYLFDTANILPILGTVFSVLSLFAYLYWNHLNDFRPYYKILRDDFFMLATGLLNITGKLVLVFSPMVFAPLSAVFFIIASVIDVAKELWYLLELNKNYRDQAPFPDNDLLVIHQQQIRNEYDYLKQRNTLIINLTSAALLSTLLITCSFFPLGLALTLSTSITIACVYLFKLIALKINEHYMSTNLQSELAATNAMAQEMEPIPLSSNPFTLFGSSNAPTYSDDELDAALLYN